MKPTKKNYWIAVGVLSTGMLSGVLAVKAQQAVSADPDGEKQLMVDHAECDYFGSRRDTFTLTADKRLRKDLNDFTVRVGRQVSTFVPSGSRTNELRDLATMGVIDKDVFGLLQEKGVSPAPKTTDYEFIRRASLDLTGRIPTAARVTAFISDGSPDKRAKYIDELMQSPEWVDKWTMFFGDLYKNTDNITAIAVNRYANGRDAFYRWIKDSLAANKPYNQMATELIAAEGGNSWSKGELNWLLAGRQTGGPVQDIYDLMAVNVADTFLGMSHMNCITCHNGRGHLDSLSLWGSQASRMQAYGMSSFYSHHAMAQVRVEGATNNNQYYWSILSDTPRPMPDYTLGTTTGNRPPRPAIGTQRVVVPSYIFSGKGPQRGEKYGTALAREVTTDFQFARATVNYIWKQFFNRGLVEPVNQFDPARLDPDNPPPAPWTLQPSNARLLNDLAQNFIDGGYDLKLLMRQIANSEAYQLSSRYDGEWNPQWDQLNARHMVRRLWSEEIVDAIAQSSNLSQSFTIRTDSFDPTQTYLIKWAMQIPSPQSATTAFINAFYRGNRNDTDRRDDGSDLQPLFLMNDTFVMNRTRNAPTTAQGTVLLAANINKTDDQLVSTLFLAILSRLPNTAEKQAALDSLKSGNRTQKAENLVWALYNKVDFFFSY